MMKKYIYLVLDFEKLWNFFPLVLFFLYIPQTLVGVFVFKDTPAFELAGVMLLGLFTYLLIYFWLSKSKISEYPSLARFAFGERLPTHYAIMTISVCYFLLISYAVLTSEKIALWEALSGASADDIGYAREALFKSRVGWERVLVYANAIFSSALMPFVLVVCYLEKKTYRHALLVLFSVSLLPSMEKVLILKALLPLIVLGFNGYFPKRRVIQFSVMAVVVIAGAFFFSKMGKIDSESDALNEIRNLQAQKVRLSEVAKSGQRSLFDLKTQLALAEKKGDNPKHVAKAVEDLLNKRKMFSDMRVAGRKYAEDFQMQLKLNQKMASRYNEDARKLLKSSIDFYLYEQPRQISIAEKAIDDELKKYPSNGVGSLEAQIEFYQYEQTRQIAVMERNIQEQLDMDLQFIERVRKYNILGPGRIAFAINRIFWIPYVTAYDWLGYFHEKLSGEYLWGRTSGLIGLITGKSNFPMERAVFSYQFGGATLTTASANASFLVDAFVNFGWIGVMVYAGLFAALTWVVVVQANPAMMACYYYFALQASMGGLSGVLFSNGMLLLICLTFFVRPRSNLVSH